MYVTRMKKKERRNGRGREFGEEVKKFEGKRDKVRVGKGEEGRGNRDEVGEREK